MTEVMTPSEITAGQIGKFQELLGAGLRKSGLQSEPTQTVLETQGDSLVTELVAVVRRRVEAIVNMIFRRVRVDRTKTATQVIDGTGRYKWYIDEEVLAEMPMLGREEDDVGFFKLNYDPTPDELDREYEARGLRPDPAATAQAMADDPAFADERPVGVQWRDSRGRACFAIFRRSVGEREVYVYRIDDGWSRRCRFSGVLKA